LWNFDAATGEFLWVKQTSYQNIVASVDAAGLVTVAEDKVLRDVGVAVSWCPSHNGGRDWPTTAYNPETRVLFIPLLNMCQESTPRATDPTPLDVYNVDIVRHLAPGKQNVGRIDAVSLSTGDTLWSWETRAPLYAPITATGGGLIFVGGLDRVFRALDQETGEVLWQTRLPGQVEGHPITYSVDGRQYVAVAAGGGAGMSNLILTPEIDGAPGGNAMFVFALPR
jgi:alcohol dehydrogenase (cytochrome c)